MDTRISNLRILLFPWLAHGHISPFLELAKSLAKRNFITYICSSPVNLSSIRSTLSPKASISIKLVELHLPTTAELPPHYHTTNGLPPHLMGQLKKALDGARPAFSALLKTLKPDIIIYDFLQPWAPEEASLQNIPAVVFLPNAASASSLLLYHFFDSKLEYPFRGIYFRENEYSIFSRMINSSGGDANDKSRVRDCVKRSSEIVLIKTFRELEGKHMDFLSEMTSKRFIPVGPLVPELGHETGDEHHNAAIMEWLDQKPPRSTIFASFGSEYFLSENEIEGIAHGLEQSELNFLWVLRFPTGERIKINEKLPSGFLERTAEKGMVVEGWVPQRQIIEHVGVGGFLSHCGWSSVMESLYSGVPIIALPMHLDQPLNARLVAEVGCGEEVMRSREGRIDGKELARVVKKVVVEKSGEAFRRMAAEMRRNMREKGESEVDGVAEELVGVCRRRVVLNQIDGQDSLDMLDRMMVMETRERRLSECKYMRSLAGPVLRKSSSTSSTTSSYFLKGHCFAQDLKDYYFYNRGVSEGSKFFETAVPELPSPSSVAGATAGAGAPRCRARLPPPTPTLTHQPCRSSRCTGIEVIIF